ncbi:MAG: zf-HC2 domain-containing protein [Proteobacteria bacterium]|nr:zf-HC2 domain-containing protein [Pseudomonadota bacterium]
MSCKDYWEMISEEIDGELEESKSLFLMRHLVICSDCFQQYRDSHQLRGFLIEENREASVFVPDGFSAKVMGIIESGEPARSPVLIQPEIESSNSISPPFSLWNIFPFLSKPSMQLSFVLSILLIASLTLFYGRSGTDIPSKPFLLDAKGLKAESMEQQRAGRDENEEDLGYYVSRHEAAASSRPANMTMVGRNSNLSYVTYSRVK